MIMKINNKLRKFPANTDLSRLPTCVIFNHSRVQEFLQRSVMYYVYSVIIDSTMGWAFVLHTTDWVDPRHLM